MKTTFSKLFEIICIAILIVTGTGKLLLLLGESQLLKVSDPVFGVENSSLLLFAGSVELGCALWAGLCLHNGHTSAIPLALISSAILCYRILLYTSGFNGYCNCLGTFSGAIPLSNETLSTAFLLIGLVMYAYSSSSIVYRLMQRATLQPLIVNTSE